MRSLAEAREDVAAVLSTVEGYSVRARPFTSAPKPGDGWVTVQRLEPSDFTRCMVVLNVVIVLHPDQASAEAAMDDDALALIDALTRDDQDDEDPLNPADVSLEPMALVTGTDSAPLYGVTLTLTLEVD